MVNKLRNFRGRDDAYGRFPIISLPVCSFKRLGFVFYSLLRGTCYFADKLRRLLAIDFSLASDERL